MHYNKDFSLEIPEIQNSLIALFEKLQNREISAKEANKVRRENNKRLKSILKELRKNEKNKSGKEKKTF